MRRLKPNELIVNPLSGSRYRILRQLGEGGFGRAYAAQSLNSRGKPVEDVCLKTTLDQSSWHREAYFGELLSRANRVIQTYDSFPLAGKSGRGQILFCLVMELAEHGTIADYLEQTGKPWSEKRAVREIVALLKVLDQLHGANATHRDLTPMNVFVCGRGMLKLADFGIARHELAGKPHTVEAFNPAFVTQGFRDWKHRHWLSVDDVYQMGQLLGVLLLGDPSETVTAKRVSGLEIDAALKQVICRAIGPRAKRFADAYEMLQALLGDLGTDTGGALDSLAGKTVAFTGPLEMKRYDAELLVLQAGGQVASSVTRAVDVVVQGKRSGNYKSGHKGTKLQQAQQLIKKGQAISIIGEAEFRRLVDDK